MQLEEGNVMAQSNIIASIGLDKNFSAQFNKDILREINIRVHLDSPV